MRSVLTSHSAVSVKPTYNIQSTDKVISPVCGHGVYHYVQQKVGHGVDDVHNEFNRCREIHEYFKHAFRRSRDMDRPGPGPLARHATYGPYTSHLLTRSGKLFHLTSLHLSSTECTSASIPLMEISKNSSSGCKYFFKASNTI